MEKTSNPLLHVIEFRLSCIRVNWIGSMDVDNVHATFAAQSTAKPRVFASLKILEA
jgi:hypothetical protein